MSYVSGDGKPRSKIVIFIVGALIVFASAYIGIDGASAFKLPFLEYLRFGALVGLAIQIFALFKMIVYDRMYVVSFVMGIIAFLCVGAYLVGTVLDLLGIITFTTDGVPYLSMSLADTVAESIMMIFFIIATDRLASQSYHGMPKLTKILVIAYIILLLLEIASYVAQLTGVTITIEFVAVVLYTAQKFSTIVKLVGTVVFLICSIIYIKD